MIKIKVSDNHQHFLCLYTRDIKIKRWSSKRPETSRIVFPLQAVINFSKSFKENPDITEYIIKQVKPVISAVNIPHLSSHINYILIHNLDITIAHKTAGHFHRNGLYFRETYAT